MNKMTFKSTIYAVTVRKTEGKEKQDEVTLIQEFDDFVEFYIGLTDFERVMAIPQKVSVGSSGLMIGDVNAGQIWERAYKLSKDIKESR